MGALKALVAPGTWAVVGGQGPPGISMHIGTSAPTDPEIDLWWDPDAEIPTVPWSTLTLASTWTQRPSAELARYRKVLDVVYVRGVVNFGAGGTNPMATLPVGYRPALAVRQGTVWTRTSDSVYLPLALEVTSLGAVNVLGLSAAGHHDINIEFPV